MNLTKYKNAQVHTKVVQDVSLEATLKIIGTTTRRKAQSENFWTGVFYYD